MMQVEESIKRLAIDRAGDLTIEDARIGLRYCAVMLENGSAGVAFNFAKRGASEGPPPDQLKTFAGKKALDLLLLFDSPNPLETSMALATANALFNTSQHDYLPGDILSHLRIGPQDRVAMIGYFAPLVPFLKDKARELKIFEENPRSEADILPATQSTKWLPNCQVALITATAIVNHTIDPLLKASSSCREVAILGPSTPMAPEAFGNSPVTLLSGIVVEDPRAILRIAGEGGGTRRFRSCTRKVNLRLG